LAVASAAETVVGGSTMSASIHRIHSAAASRTPVLRWALRSGPPRTAVSASSRASSYVPSVLALSTTINSTGTSWARIERRQASSVRIESRVGTTTATLTAAPARPG
jgi:hypothetical protein